MKNLQLSILKHKEDGNLTLSYKGIDFEDYNYLTVSEFIEEVEAADSWDAIEPEIYEKALEKVGIDYKDYDDPDKMWKDFKKAVEK